MLLSIVIPAFNESSRIGPTLKETYDYFSALEFKFEIIIVNDGSSDDIDAVIESFGYPNVHIIRNDKNKGKGYSVKRGVLSSVGEWVLIMDADLSTDLASFPKLFERKESHQMIIGSRGLQDSILLEKQPFIRMIAGKVFRFTVKTILGIEFYDTQCGFKLIRGDIGRTIFNDLFTNGFSFDVEVIYRYTKLGYSVHECGVIWRNHRDSRVSLVVHPLSMFLELLQIKARV